MENRQNNDQKRTDKTMTKREQTKQWPKENRQNNDQKRTDKTMTKRKGQKNKQRSIEHSVII
jgi:hypothetical protein